MLTSNLLIFLKILRKLQLSGEVPRNSDIYVCKFLLSIHLLSIKKKKTSRRKALVHKCSSTVFLKVWTLLNRDSNTGVFPWNLRIFFMYNFFLKNTSGVCFWKTDSNLYLRKKNLCQDNSHARAAHVFKEKILEKKGKIHWKWHYIFNLITPYLCAIQLRSLGVTCKTPPPPPRLLKFNHSKCSETAFCFFQAIMEAKTSVKYIKNNTPKLKGNSGKQ